MTTKRRDNGKESTEFGMWLRLQDDICSSQGYVATDIDYVWKNIYTGYWIIIEEKRFAKELGYLNNPRPFQQNLLQKLNNILIESDELFNGIWILKFERTNPDDGKIFIKYINKEKYTEITKQQLIEFLQFKYTENMKKFLSSQKEHSTVLF